MPTYKTPGVYVEEIATLPPSVAAVATAIPAFLGYTESGPLKQPIRLTSMVDYAQYFGGPKSTAFTVTQSLSGELQVTKTATGSTTLPDYLMYYSLKMYFDNGGGPCLVVSVGKYASNRLHSDFTDGLNALAKEDEPTLILLTDAVNFSDSNDYYGLCGEALAQCEKLGNRFAILDVLDGDTGGQAFRNASGIGINHLKYGAAYYPYLKTTLPYDYHDKSQVNVILPSTYQPDGGGIKVISTYTSLKVDIQQAATAGAPLDFAVAEANSTLTMKNVPASGIDAKTLVDAWKTWKAKNNPLTVDVTQDGTDSIKVQPTSGPVAMTPLSTSTSTLDTLVNSQTQLYNQVVAALALQWIVMPPSPAIAGIYAAVDRDRGVWKAPANVSIASVIGPKVKVTNDDQDNLNVDPTAGKSINAIRSFVGKGTLVWGARTLAGNDNEWRYVNVRRLFNMIEDSTRKASAFAVFEPNDATTWLKVKGMIEAFLHGLWEQGALAGPTPQSAYFVNVGLGKTMTTQDILEGRMIVEIGIAAVRPAEFIIIRFSHKLQDA